MIIAIHSNSEVDLSTLRLFFSLFDGAHVHSISWLCTPISMTDFIAFPHSMGWRSSCRVSSWSARRTSSETYDDVSWCQWPIFCSSFFATLFYIFKFQRHSCALRQLALHPVFDTDFIAPPHSMSWCSSCWVSGSSARGTLGELTNVVWWHFVISMADFSSDLQLFAVCPTSWLFTVCLSALLTLDMFDANHKVLHILWQINCHHQQQCDNVSSSVLALCVVNANRDVAHSTFNAKHLYPRLHVLGTKVSCKTRPRVSDTSQAT